MTTSLVGYASSINPVTQIVCAYASGSTTLRARSGTTRWIVIGNFTLPEAVRARINVLGLVSDGATCSVAIYDPSLVVNSSFNLVVGGAEQLSVGSPIDLVPNKRYQIAVVVQTDVEADNKFAVIRTVSLGDV